MWSFISFIFYYPWGPVGNKSLFCLIVVAGIFDGHRLAGMYFRRELRILLFPGEPVSRALQFAFIYQRLGPVYLALRYHPLTTDHQKGNLTALQPAEYSRLTNTQNFGSL